MGYQPAWRDGQVLAAGERDCADRYAAIRDVLAGLGGPLMALDLGANSGYFARRIVADFPAAHVTAVDPRPEVHQAAGERIDVYQQRVTAAELRAMARVDVVLALSVLHHMADWPAVLDQVRACRRWAIVEVPDPRERWMRSAAARHQLPAIHHAVDAAATAKLGAYPRRGRDGVTYLRPMYLLPGTVQQLSGRVFGGSGTCSRKLTPALHGRGLDRELGYQPYPGSLNLRCAQPVDLGPPAVDWPGRVGTRRRPYQFWPAWVGDLACHVMVPGPRGHGPDCVELVAPVRLRDALSLADGDTVTVDVARG